MYDATDHLLPRGKRGSVSLRPQGCVENIGQLIIFDVAGNSYLTSLHDIREAVDPLTNAPERVIHVNVVTPRGEVSLVKVPETELRGLPASSPFSVIASAIIALSGAITAGPVRNERSALITECATRPKVAGECEACRAKDCARWAKLTISKSQSPRR